MNFHLYLITTDVLVLFERFSAPALNDTFSERITVLTPYLYISVLTDGRPNDNIL